MKPLSPERMLFILLRLVAVHSLLVGIAMIIVPEYVLTFLGYHTPDEVFFRAQGGVFHLVMAVAYWFGSKDIREHRGLVVFSIITKLLAFTFLMTYFILVDPIWIVFFSAIGDGIMGLALLWSFRRTALHLQSADIAKQSAVASLKTQRYPDSESL